MASMISGTQGRDGVKGRKPYETRPSVDRFKGLSLKDKLRAICTSVRTSDRDQRTRRNSTFYLMALYYQGYQNVELNSAGNAFDVYEKEDFYVENQFRRHVDAVVNSLSKMEGDIVVRPASINPQDLAKSRAAGPILELQKQGIGYDRVKDQKNLYKALFGNAFVFVDYITDPSYGTIVTPKYSYEEIPDPAGGDPYTTKKEVGVETRNRGKEIAVVCSPLEVFVRPDTKGFENIPYLQWVSRQDIDVLNHMYKGLNISGGGTTLDTDLAGQYLEVLENLPGNILGDSLAFNQSSPQAKKTEYSRTWLQPCMFAGDAELVKKFPNGVHVAMVGGEVVDFYEENLLDRWTHEVLIPVPHSLLGDGLYDALLMQDQINEMDSLIIKHTRYSTVGHKVYDRQIIDINDVMNDPAHGWIPGNAPLDKSIEQSVKQLLPNPLSPDVGKWLESSKAAMQDMSSAYDPSIGKGIGANTPYSQSVFLTERAQSRWQGSIAWNRPELLRFHRQLLSIAQNEWLEAKSMAVADNTGSWTFQQFSQLDLVGDVDLILSNADLQPKSRAEQIQALEMFQNLQGIFPLLSAKQKLYVEEVLGLPPDSNPLTTQIARAYRNIERIKNGEVVTPMPLIDDPSQVPVFQDYLASEQGESLAMENPEAYANVYTFMVNLVAMSQMSAGLNIPGQTPPGGPSGSPNQGADKGTPGGQPGQPGGGPKSDNTAQSPSPAPPVSPPA